MEGEPSPQAASSSEDSSIAVSRITQRFVLRNKGILTSKTPKKQCLSMDDDVEFGDTSSTLQVV
jgi:hypothetical protein